MLKKIVLAALALTLIGAIGVALLDSQTAASDTQALVARAATIEPTIEATIEPQPIPGAGDGTGPVQLQQSASQVGDPWTGSGQIAALDGVGLTLALADGSQIFVELGPTAYWQSQGVTLAVGDTVTISGFFNGEQYHTGTLTTADGAQIVMRDEAGQPLWSGGNGGQGGDGAGGANETLIPMESWVTLNGVVTAVTNNGLTMQAEDGQIYTLQFGRADFWTSQAVTFAVGDAVSAMGFWQGDQFQTGQITKTATGERILLRDPNGRPLWGGPGRNGNGNGNGNGGAAATAAPDKAQGSGQGRQWRGGRS
ncbi:MAG: hypothetical protein HXY41_11375 [Chloroflexi bacterium]|nr:hypothetical protein [Chloroflexota bacterium]